MVSLEYAAGIIDGEGNIQISCDRKRKTPHHELVVRVRMKSYFVPTEFQKAFGGDLFIEKGNILTWRIRSNKAGEFLDSIFPFLIAKKTEAWLALEFLAQRKLNQGHGLSEEELALREGFKLAISEAHRIGYNSVNDYGPTTRIQRIGF